MVVFEGKTYLGQWALLCIITLQFRVKMSLPLGNATRIRGMGGQEVNRTGVHDVKPQKIQ